MNNTCKDFALSIARQSPELQTIYDATFRDWSPDQPPVTLLFGDLGDQIAKGFLRQPAHDQQLLFAEIESAMASADEELLAAVATGFIEAMVTVLESDQVVLQQVLCDLGPRSRSHANAWLSFGS